MRHPFSSQTQPGSPSLHAMGRKSTPVPPPPVVLVLALLSPPMLAPPTPPLLLAVVVVAVEVIGPAVLVMPPALELVNERAPVVAVSAAASSFTLFRVVLEQASCKKPTPRAPAKSKRRVLSIDASYRGARHQASA